MKKCKLWWCDSPAVSRGICKVHYVAFRRTGSPLGKDVGDRTKILNEIVCARSIIQTILPYTQDTLPEGVLESAKSFLDRTDGEDGVNHV